MKIMVRDSMNQFYYVEDVMKILGVAQTKAYSIIKELREELKQAGYVMPPAGRIHKSYFCERLMLDKEELV